MSTTFAIKTLHGTMVNVAFRSNGIHWIDASAMKLLPNSYPVIATENSPQGIETIRDIKKAIRKQLAAIANKAKKEYRFAIACINEFGDSDFYFVKVRCASSALNGQKADKAAVKWVKSNFIVSNPVAFSCDYLSQYAFLAKRFEWKTASVVEI